MKCQETNKKFTQNNHRKTKPTQFDSKARVIPKRTHGKGIWNGERVAVTIRIDEKLYRAVKPVLKRYFGSVCGAIEPYLTTIYEMSTTNKLSGEHGVIPSITMDIKNMNIRRHLKPRRKLIVEEDAQVDYLVSEYCHVVSCMSAPVAKLENPDGEGFWFCKKHYQLPLDQGWHRVDVHFKEES